MFVDNSIAFRMDPNVPLVIPEINPEDVRRHKGHHHANPNCTTIVSLVTINALNQDSPSEHHRLLLSGGVGAGPAVPVSFRGGGGLLPGKPVTTQVFHIRSPITSFPR